MESCNGIDDNCNGQVDEGLTVLRYYQDLDGDGYGVASNSIVDCQPPVGYVEFQGDCDDTNASIFPGQTESPYNGIDDDCDPSTLDDDLDQDGFLLAEDCDDTNAGISPDAEEIPNNGIDEDCDGMDLLSAVHNTASARISIYPNPTSEVIYIDVDGPLDFQVNLYGIDGRLLKATPNSNELQIESLPRGTYLLEIVDNKSHQRIIERIVVER